MLPYPTHAHPTTSSRGHAYSHPNPNDQNFQKRHGRSRPASLPTNVRARTRVWRTTITKIITQGQEWEHNAKKTPNWKQHWKDGFYMNPKANKTIHHEITQPTSIREYGFYTNPNDVTRPKVMNSLYRPQSESVDSTRILVSTKQKPRSKRNQITGNRNHSTEHKVGNTGATRIPMQHKHAKVVWMISKRINQVHDPHCANKTRENRAARKTR